MNLGDHKEDSTVVPQVRPQKVPVPVPQVPAPQKVTEEEE